MKVYEDGTYSTFGLFIPETLEKEINQHQMSRSSSGIVDDSFTYGVRKTGVAFYKEGLLPSIPLGWGFQLYINFDFTIRRNSTDTIHSSSINKLSGVSYVYESSKRVNETSSSPAFTRWSFDGDVNNTGGYVTTAAFHLQVNLQNDNLSVNAGGGY